MSIESKFEKLIEMINRCNENFVFLLDNLDMLIQDPEQLFKEFVDLLMEKCPNVCVIITCRDPVL